LLRRAAWTVALQSAAATVVVVLLVAAVALVVDARQRSAEAERLVRATWQRADDVDDPPAGVWIVAVAAGRREATPGAPDEVAGVDPTRLPDGLSRLPGDEPLLVWTGDRRIGRVSAVGDLAATERERDRLLTSLAVAAAVGIAGAAAVGAGIARRAVRPLGAALGLQRRFVTDASHELRTPLAVLLTRAQLLRRRLPPGTPPDRVAELDRVIADAKQLGEVVQDLLLSAELGHRGDAGAEVDLAALAADVAASLQPLATERSVTLTATVDDAAPPVLARGAPVALRRAAVSLTDNALAHAGTGGNVALRTGTAGGEVWLAVADDGDGLDPRDAARLVRRFSRDSDHGTGRRFGLGLALVDEVARAHGGRLTIDGTPGAGATFTIHLPAAGT
jgi:signal transduction histidine kinase